VEDFGCGIVRFKNGAAAMLENGWSTFVRDPTFSIRVLGTQAGATLLPFTVVAERDGKAVDVTPDPKTLAAEDQFHHFVRCVREGGEPTSSIEQGATMVRMLDALYRSHGTGRWAEIRTKTT
jgi:predicted dehydrogenase